jgi:hypothetical protein
MAPKKTETKSEGAAASKPKPTHSYQVCNHGIQHFQLIHR